MASARVDRFIDEFLICGNGAEAARRAGYSEKYADRTAWRLLHIPAIAEVIEEAQQARSRRTHITADYVLSSLKAVADRCMQAEMVLDHKGNPTGEFRFDSGGANKSLELLGKHLKLWTDKMEVSGHLTHEQWIEQLMDESDGTAGTGT